MRRAASNRKRRRSYAPHTSGSAGPRAQAALQPPDYGIDLVDRHTVQLRADPESERAASGISLGAPGTVGQPLPAMMRARMEGLLGVDLAPVRVHEGEAAESLGAVAFTRGHDICFARGRYEPHTPRGRRVLGHEIAHVVQQSEGRASATGSRRGVPVNDAPHLEREADRAGLRATSGEPAARGSLRSLPSAPGTVAQCILYQDIVDDWVDGDKIYGLNAARADTVDALDHLGHNETIIDDLNNQFIGTGLIGDPKYPKTYDEDTRLNSPQAKAFRKALHSHPKYDPRMVPDENVSLTRVKRACKGGLKHVTKSGNTIHFILDIIKMDWVIHKTGPMDIHQFTAEGDKSRDITGAELRYLYRHRNDKKVIRNVRFWKGGHEVEAPWITDPLDWAQYDPVSERPKPKTKKKWGCFLTTACTAARGLPDDCHELTTLRAFRDTYMRSLPNGPALIDEYYEVAPRIVAAIERRDDRRALLDALYNRVTEAVRLIEADRLADAFTLYADMVQALRARLL